MATPQQIKDFENKMAPYAQQAESILGKGKFHWQSILTQWGLETGYGTSEAATKLNNYAGIKDNSNGKDYNGGTYAGYNSIDSFVRDYTRLMKLHYYTQVLNTGSIENDFVTLDKSPWATDPSYLTKLEGTYNSLKGLMGSGSTGLNFGSAYQDFLDKYMSLDNPTRQKVITVGIGALILLGLLK